jgi:MFS family permease
MSVFFGAFNVGIIAGAPLGGLFAEWLGLASPLFVYAAFCFASAWLFWRRIYDPERHPEERPGRWRQLPRTRAFAAALFTNLAYLWFVGAIYSTLVPVFGRDELHMDYAGVGFAIAVATFTELIVLFPAGKATDTRGRRAVLLPSLTALAITAGVLGLTSVPVVFLVLMGIMGVASGFAGVPPAPMLGDVTPTELKGTAVGLFRFCGDLGFVVGPLVAGWTADVFGFTTAFALTAVPVLAAMILVASNPETMRRREARPAEVGL